MKCALTIQEKLKDLRTEKGLTLERLAEETQLSRSALQSYEANESKDISHRAIISLAKFYGVSTDYLLGLTENRKKENARVADLKLDDDAAQLLRSGCFNNRLFCEIIRHPGFWKLMSDTEIYVDGLAEMQIHNLNDYVKTMRSKIMLYYETPENEHFLRTLDICQINEDDYFGKLMCDDLTSIARDIKQAHRKDHETADEGDNPLNEIYDFVDEYLKADDPLKGTLLVLGKMLGMNMTKMDSAELEFFISIVEKYSTVYRNMVKRSRGKKNVKSVRKAKPHPQPSEELPVEVSDGIGA